MPQIFKFKNLSRIFWLGQGISTKDFGNISLYVGDSKKKVFTNREKFFKAVGDLSENDVIEMQQIHGNHVKVVGKEEKGQLILDTDAIITNESGIALIVKTADCVPVLLVDPVNKVVGAVHAGWRGTAQEIARLTVTHMEDHFGTKPADLVVGIGPSIGPCCYEVGTLALEVFKRFPYANKLFSKVHDDYANLDLWRANKFQLIETGVKEGNIEIANICTFENTDKFFSERKENLTGRFGAVIWFR